MPIGVMEYLAKRVVNVLCLKSTTPPIVHQQLARSKTAYLSLSVLNIINKTIIMKLIEKLCSVLDSTEDRTEVS